MKSNYLPQRFSTLVKSFALLSVTSLFVFGDCNTDPSVIGPSARLQVFSRTGSSPDIDIMADDKTRTPAPSTVTVVGPNTIIKASGFQLDKNVKEVSLIIKCEGSRRCSYTQEYTTYGTPPGEPCSDPNAGVYTWPALNGADGTVAHELPLIEYLRKWGCPDGYPLLEANVSVVVRAKNIKGKITETNPVKLKIYANYPLQEK